VSPEVLSTPLVETVKTPDRAHSRARAARRRRIVVAVARALVLIGVLGLWEVLAFKSTLPMFTKDGVMPADGPATVEKVLKAFNPDIQNAKVDLGKTYTTEFVKKAG
jgi:hypothetical protein